jgi:putative transposase
MEMEKKAGGHKKYSRSEKLAILSEAKKHGVLVTLAKYDLYPATYYYWKKRHHIYGESGLEHQKVKDQAKQIEQLEAENMRLKVLLAEKELQNSVKELQVKKNLAVWRKRP